MIYFDKPTQQALVHRFWEVLEPGGHLFVGHSESLTNASKRISLCAAGDLCEIRVRLHPPFWTETKKVARETCGRHC